ncbi:unnamed protein product, partial [Rotaria sordida]
MILASFASAFSVMSVASPLLDLAIVDALRLTAPL